MKVLQGGPSRNMYNISIFDHKNPDTVQSLAFIHKFDSYVQDFKTENIHRIIIVKMINNIV
jgi:hypothetical protein